MDNSCSDLDELLSHNWNPREHFNGAQLCWIVDVVLFSRVNLEAFQWILISSLNSETRNRCFDPQLNHQVSLLVLTLVSESDVEESRTAKLIRKFHSGERRPRVSKHTINLLGQGLNTWRERTVLCLAVDQVWLPYLFCPCREPWLGCRVH